MVKKAGCILLDLENKKIGLIYRNKQNDYSFPKGHLEKNETLMECAIRETKEETGRLCEILDITLPTMTYVDSIGDLSKCYHYLAVDKGPCKEIFDQELVHKLVWTDFEEVEKILTYPSLTDLWQKIKPLVKNLFD